ncbi:nuclease-related domain-containing protein [Ilumatobacter sp.]|uniref:nuclease-related domain-containing protein n=1 Tax=Ilumatobacter sp. TaxID=1967498 RepID=UPI003B52DAA1
MTSVDTAAELDARADVATCAPHDPAPRFGTRELIDAATCAGTHVMHARRIPGTRTTIDHLVVGPTGVWVIASREESCPVEVRPGRIGAERGPQLYVGGRNRTSLVVDSEWQVAAVRRVLEPIGRGGVPVTAAICFPDPSCWSTSAGPLRVASTVVADADDLVRDLLRPRSFTSSAVSAVSRRLDDELPPV